MTNLYPKIEPYQQGMLEVGDGNRVYWETCGNPEGKPAVVVHGGPGSGCSMWQRRLFDPPRIASCCSISAAAGGARHTRANPTSI